MFLYSIFLKIYEERVTYTKEVRFPLSIHALTSFNFAILITLFLILEEATILLFHLKVKSTLKVNVKTQFIRRIRSTIKELLKNSG